ncbi:hypothetical protein Hanom_Chr06g00541341 [Helianthus anomalus]
MEMKQGVVCLCSVRVTPGMIPTLLWVSFSSTTFMLLFYLIRVRIQAICL